MFGKAFISLIGATFLLMLGTESRSQSVTKADPTHYFVLNRRIYKESGISAIIFIINGIVYNKTDTIVNSYKVLDSLSHVEKYICLIKEFPKGNKKLEDKFSINANKFIIRIRTTKKEYKDMSDFHRYLRRVYFNSKVKIQNRIQSIKQRKKTNSKKV